MSENELTERVAALLASPMEHDGQRVVTLPMIDKVHGRPEGTAGRLFRDNRSRFVEGRDYFVATRAVLQATSNVGRNPAEVVPIGSSVVLLTERGYTKLTKPMRDDVSWQVHDVLVDTYFAAREAMDTFARGLIDEVQALRVEVAEMRAENMRAWRDTHQAARALAASTSAHAAGLAIASRVSPRLKVLAQEDPDQERLFLSYAQIVEDRARQCGGRLTPTEAAALLGVSTRKLGRMKNVPRTFSGTRRPYRIEDVRAALPVVAS